MNQDDQNINNGDKKLTLNLTEKLRDKLNDLMSVNDDSETDLLFEALEKLHTSKYIPFKKMMELKKKNSEKQLPQTEEENPFHFERNIASDEAYLATLEEELKDYKNRGDTEMIFLTKEKIDKVKDKIREGKAY